MDGTRGPRVSSCMVLALCGLPGAGKTTLAQALARWAAEKGPTSTLHADDRPIEVRHVSFDQVYDELPTDTTLGDSGGNHPDQVLPTFTTDRWHASRQQALDLVQRAILESITPELVGTEEGTRRQNDVLIVIDDNLYYRSMRHQCYQLARSHMVPFGQVYIKVPIAVALERNDRRVGLARVPPQVIERMCERFEEPEPDVYSWERHTLTLTQWEDPDDALHGAEDEASNCNTWEKLWHDIDAIWRDDWIREQITLQREQERKAEHDREASMANLVHQLDQRLRRRVTAMLTTNKQGKAQGKLFAGIKRTILDEARHQLREGGGDEVLLRLEEEFTRRCSTIRTTDQT